MIAMAANTTIEKEMEPTITIGADPEIFLVDGNGKYISSVGKIGGSKDQPLPIGEGCAVQEDNVAVEFNIEPADTVEKFLKSCTYALEELTKRAMNQGLALSIVASKTFSDDQLQDKQTRAFGCDPDYNAWTGEENEPPRADDPNLRSCGGHVHIGVPAGLGPKQLARWCDVKLGLASILEDDLEGTLMRRALYGKAGAFRPKPYGIEYRVLSPYWLQTERLTRMVFWRAKQAARMVREGHILSDTDGVKIQMAINTGDKKLAEELIKQYNIASSV